MSPLEFARSLLQAVSRPHRFFDENPPSDSLGQAAVVLFVAVLSSVAFLLLG